VCGNGTLEFPEACDDNNLANADGCNDECREEFLVGIENTASTVQLLDRVTGEVVRQLLANPNPLYVLQLPSREILVSDTANRVVSRYDVHGSFVDNPFLDTEARSLDMLGSVLIQARGINPFQTFDPVTFAYQADVGLTDDGWAMAAIDDRWFLSIGISWGELLLYDSTENEGPYALYSGQGALDLTVTDDRRVLVPDFAAGQVVELKGSNPVSPALPLGQPLALDRSVDLADPFSVFELPGGNWLIGHNAGLGTYDPNTGLLVEHLSDNRFRQIRPYIGPLQDE